MTGGGSVRSEMRVGPNEKSSEASVSFTADAVRAEMLAHVQTIAGLAPEDSRKAALRFTARLLGLPFARVKAHYYGEARQVPAHEADQVRAYVAAAEKLIEARAKYEAERAAFCEAHPALARLAPPALPKNRVGVPK